MHLTTKILATGLAATTAAGSGDNWLSQSWDAVVVGAGTAGIIVADRLSEAGHKVLLLEQGGKSYGTSGGLERPAWLNGTKLSRVDVPGLYMSIFDGKSSLLCKPDQVSAYQACTLGGNSAINAGLYFQPPAADWDDYHIDGWHSADVKSAVQRLLLRQPALTHYSPDNDFYVQSSYDAVQKWIVGAAGFANTSFLQDTIYKDGVFGRPAYNYINGQRGGPARTYLQSALSRNTFRLETGVHVRHVKHARGKASGVSVKLADGRNKTITLARNGRVVLSAGALLSPRILMFSGIGPQETLARLAVSAVTPYNASSWVIQPQVGNGLFDNPNTFIVLSSPDIQSYTYKYDNPISQDRDQYLETRSGPYSFAGQTSVFWSSVNHSDGTRAGVQGTVSSSGYADFTGNTTITLNVYGTSGLSSSGRVELSDDGHFVAQPSSDVYYSHKQDGEDIATFIHSLFQHLPPSSPDTPAEHGLTPLNLARNSTLDEIYKYVTTPSAYAKGSVQHWSSSCRLGKCVDVDARVIGTQNIHVVDASILSPMTVSPQFATMVAAERGAERILARWRNTTYRGARRRKMVSVA